MLSECTLIIKYSITVVTKGFECTSLALAAHLLYSVTLWRMPPRTRSLKNVADSQRYDTLRAPPSILPTRKYCDITGLPAKYTHPNTNIRYANATLYQYINASNIDVIHTLLDIRGVQRIIK